MSNITTYATIVPDFFIQLNLLLKGYVYNEYTQLANALKLPMMGALTVYVALYGLSLSLGWIEGHFNHFVKTMFKISFILTFAFHWGMFSQYIVTGIQSTADLIASTLLKASILPGFDFSSGHLNDAMQLLITEITQVGGWIWQHGTWHDFSPYLIAIVYWTFGFLAILIGLVEITISYMGLAILFTLAPFFIACTLFSATYGFFDRWIGTIAGFAFTLIFISSAMALVLNLLQWIVVDYYTSRAADIRLVSWVGILFVGFISVSILRQMACTGKLIGNGICTFSSNNGFAEKMGGSLISASAGAALLSANALGKSAAFANDLVSGKTISNVSASVREKLRKGDAS